MPEKLLKMLNSRSGNQVKKLSSYFGKVGMLTQEKFLVIESSSDTKNLIFDLVLY